MTDDRPQRPFTHWKISDSRNSAMHYPIQFGCIRRPYFTLRHYDTCWHVTGDWILWSLSLLIAIVRVSKISAQTSDLVVTWWAGGSLHGHSGHLLVMVVTVLQWPSSGSVECTDEMLCCTVWCRSSTTGWSTVATCASSTMPAMAIHMTTKTQAMVSVEPHFFPPAEQVINPCGWGVE